jgi:hypothetical protein
MNLTNDLLAQLQGAPLQQIATQLGVDQKQAAGAIGSALPFLMGALGNNAAKPQGAQALLGALQTNHSGLDIGSVLSTVLGGQGNAAATNGAGILGHILGAKQQGAQSSIAQATGLQNAQAGQLMQILAPIVMAYLGKQVSGGNANALGSLLSQEQQSIRQQSGTAGQLLGSLLDQDGDGKLGLGDLLKVGGSLLGGKR